MNTVTIPDFRRLSARSFDTPRWDAFAGEAGAFVARSHCGQFEAIAERAGSALRFWLVRTSDGATVEALECAS